MTRTIIVAGFGPGISESVARRFGKEGYAVALVGRTAERIQKAEQALTGEGITARAFQCDLGDVEATRVLVGSVRKALGPIAVIHWNAYRREAGDLTTAPTSELRAVLDVGVHGLVAAVQEALPDLKTQKGGILVTGGGLAYYDPVIDKMASEWGAMGLAVAKAAQHKIVGILHQKLAADGIYVGEVTVQGIVKKTWFAERSGGGQIDPDDIANQFWDIFQKRTDIYVSASPA